MTYVLIDTGYDEDYEYRLGNNYENFVEFYKTIEDLIAIDGWVRPGYENIVENILANTRRLFNSVGNPIFKTTSATLDDINRIIQKVRDLDYCHVWQEDPIDKTTLSIIDGMSVVTLKLEAESG